MLSYPSQKYRPFPPVPLADRQWPSRSLTAAPIWCSVDLRDGNQALAVPMNVSQKLAMFEALVKCGFKEIEIGFPAASNTEFAFNRRLIEEGRIPDDVTVQVLVQAREDLIERTVESLMGAKRCIIHLYNSTSPAQRRVVFGKSRDEIREIAVRGAQWVKDRLPRLVGTDVRLQYSPESFSATELDFAKEISEAVMDVWQPTPERRMILNLPDTVEVAMPNVYADQIEWMCRNIRNRESLIVSLHAHNDRGTGVAATELGILAGADRVEGTLFGNGERTGNLDIITVAMNLYMHGIAPGLDFSDMNALIAMYEHCTGMTIPPRQPYAGELVFTAFSGSHQDAIKKGLAEWEKKKNPRFEDFWDAVKRTPARLVTFVKKDSFVVTIAGEKMVIVPKSTGTEHKFTQENARKVWRRCREFFNAGDFAKFTTKSFQSPKPGVWADCPDRNAPWVAVAIYEFLKTTVDETCWDVPYLTIDPADLGREYREVIRVNSQSGKGGVAYLLESEFGIELPKDLQREFGPIANDAVDQLGREVSGTELRAMFWSEYVERTAPWQLVHFHADGVGGVFHCRASAHRDGTECHLTGEGNGPIAAFVQALTTSGVPAFTVSHFKQHALSSGSDASAISYVQLRFAGGRTKWGAGVDTNIELASIKAVLSAVNRSA